MIKSILNTPNIFNIPVWYKLKIKIACKYLLIKDKHMKGVRIMGFIYENENILSRIDFTERFYFSYMLPMQYNSVIYAKSKYLSILSINMSSLESDCIISMPF